MDQVSAYGSGDHLHGVPRYIDRHLLSLKKGRGCGAHQDHAGYIRLNVDSDDLVPIGSVDRRHRDGLYAQVVVPMVDLGFNRVAGGDHGLDVPGGSKHLPPAAKDAWDAFSGR